MTEHPPFPVLLSYENGICQPLWVGYFPDEPSGQQFCYLFADGPAFFFVEAAQALLHRLGAWVDFQGMLGNLPQDAWHIRGFPRKDVFVVAEEVDERAFLFRGERGPDADFSTLGAARIQQDLPGAFCRFKRPG